MINTITIIGNQPSQVARNVRAFKVILPSLGSTFQVDSGQKYQLTTGDLYEFQPRSGEGIAGPTSDSVLALNQLRKINAALRQEDYPGDLLPNKVPKLYPDIAFNVGTNSPPLTVIVDIEDGNPYVAGALGFAPVSAIAQEGDLDVQAALYTLNTSTQGILGVPLLTRDSGTGRLITLATSGGAGGLNVNSASSAMAQQSFDTTPAAGAAVNSGALGSNASPINHVLVRLAGLTAPSSRVLQLLAQRNDATTVVIASTTFASTITDATIGFGTGDSVPALPAVGSTTFYGFSVGAMLPTTFQVNLTAGAAGDNPRVTIWTRTSS